MHFRLVSAAAAAALALSSSHAEAGSPVHSLTLRDAIRLALAHNPDNLSAQEDVHAAMGALVQSRAFENPALFVNSVDYGIRPADFPIPNQFGISWVIPVGGKRAAGISAAKAELDAARAASVAARRQLELDVESAFVTVLLDRSQLEFARKDQATIHRALEINEVRYKDGKIAYGDVLKLRIQARTVDDTVRQDELRMAEDRADLARVIGEGVLAPEYTVEGSLAPPKLPAEPTIDELLRRALSKRPDYRALLALESSAHAAVVQARRQPIPDLEIFADYNRVPGEAGSYDLGVAAEIPLLNRNGGSVTQARAEQRKARLATESLRAQLRADAAKAVKAWETSQARLEMYDEELLSAARESLDISRHAYEQGRGTLLDFLDAEASYREVESAYRSAVADAMLAAAGVRFVAGEELP